MDEEKLTSADLNETRQNPGNNAQKGPSKGGLTENDRKMLDAYNPMGVTTQVGFNENISFSNSRSMNSIAGITSLIKEDAVAYNNYLHVTMDDKVNALLARYKFMEETLQRESCIQCSKLKLFERNSEEMSVFARLTFDCDDEINPHKVMFEFLDENGEVGDIEADFTGLDGYLLFPNQYMILRGQLDNQRFIVNDYYPKVKGPDPQNFSAKEASSHYQVLFYSGPYLPDTSTKMTGLEIIERHIRKFQPNLVILSGPFMPKENRAVKENAIWDVDHGLVTYAEHRRRELLYIFFYLPSKIPTGLFWRKSKAIPRPR
jgi:hypothetical protein